MTVFLLLFLLVFPLAATGAEFNIYQSGYKPLHLAWLVDSGTADQESASQIEKVVGADLVASQSFEAMDPVTYLADASAVLDKIEYGDWRIIGADTVAAVRLSRSGDAVMVSLQVHDPFRSALLVKRDFKGSTRDLRTLSHAVADAIYEAALKMPGHFQSKLIFVKRHGDAADLLYTDWDGYNNQIIGRNFSLLLSPDFSPDNRLVALNTYVGNRPRLELFNLTNGSRTVLAQFKGLNSAPAWSSDGRYIAAALSFTGNTELHLYDVRSGRWRQLTKHPAIDTSPSFSPDSKWIAFTSDRDGSPQVYRLNVESGAVQRVSQEGSYNTSPAWSPRGDRIAYVSLRNWQYALATALADGSDVRYIASADRMESPAWSPNAQMLLFTADENRKHRLYRIPAWGGVATAITAPGLDASNPAWSH